jgi:DNA-binding LacI/PurR family transcriptional regulator
MIVVSEPSPPTKADQVAGRILELIDEHPVEVGKRLPSVRTLATRYAASVPTVQNAMRLLEGRGIVRCESRRGAFVLRRPRFAAPAQPRTKQVGVVQCFHGREESAVVDQFDSWWARIKHAMDAQLQLHGYQTVSLPIFLEVPDSVDRFVATVNQWRDHLAGIISTPRPMYLDAVDHHDLPLVTVNALRPHDTSNFVTAANRDAHARFARALVRMGIKRVTLAVGDLKRSTSELDRLLGLTQGFAEAGAPLNMLDVTTLTPESINEPELAARKINTYLDQLSELPEVIVASGDDMAYGIIHGLTERGLRVPKDIGVVGGTGYRDEMFGVMPLTVIAQPMAEIGSAAADMLVQIIESGNRHLPPRFVPSRAIVRKSFLIPDDIRRQLDDEYDASVAQYRQSVEAFA